MEMTFWSNVRWTPSMLVVAQQLTPHFFFFLRPRPPRKSYNRERHPLILCMGVLDLSLLPASSLQNALGEPNNLAPVNVVPPDPLCRHGEVQTISCPILIRVTAYPMRSDLQPHSPSLTCTLPRTKADRRCQPRAPVSVALLMSSVQRIRGDEKASHLSRNTGSTHLPLRCPRVKQHHKASREYRQTHLRMIWRVCHYGRAQVMDQAAAVHFHRPLVDRGLHSMNPRTRPTSLRRPVPRI